jgi:hypothetical protein
MLCARIMVVGCLSGCLSGCPLFLDLRYWPTAAGDARRGSECGQVHASLLTLPDAVGCRGLVERKGTLLWGRPEAEEVFNPQEHGRRGRFVGAACGAPRDGSLFWTLT